MVAVKNVFFAASCVASALAAPATKRQDWGNGGGEVGGWNQGQGGQSWDQGQGQDQSQGQDSGDVPSVPIAGDGQSSGSSDVPSVPIAGDGQSSGSTDASAGNTTTDVDASNSGADASAGAPSSAAAVDGETLTESSSGQSGDYYYSHWVENNSGASMTLGSGQYSLEWTEASGNIVSGIGWNPASAR